MAPMNDTLLTYLGIVCLIAAACAGCTGTGTNAEKTPAATPAGPEPMMVIFESMNGTTVTVDQGSQVSLELDENPSTGYQWNLTLSPGLQVTNEEYLDVSPNPFKPESKLGSGGTRIWEIRAVQPGSQTIGAVYRRPLEPVAGNETVFFVTLDVKKA